MSNRGPGRFIPTLGAPAMIAAVLRALVFDFNGVLVDDEPIHLRMFQRALEPEGIVLRDDAYYERFLGFDDRGCFTAVLEEAGVAITRFAHIEIGS